MLRPRRYALLAPLTLALVLFGSGTRLTASTRADLPSRLTDVEFWRLSEGLSEPEGVFQSDNLLSNEMVFDRIVPDLIARTKPGSVYLGVGPEQNFTYIAAMKPRMAFITDIRRGNLHVQLMYKALFELSRDRAEFVSRLFTKPQPPGLTPSSTAIELMNAYWEMKTADEAAYAANLAAIENHLTKTHGFPVSADDLAGIARVYRAFYWYGPRINPLDPLSLSPSRSGLDAHMLFLLKNYRDLMTQTDGAGQGLSYLASEEGFSFLKDLEHRNLVVPVVGNFAGPKAIRAVGAYLRDRKANVSAFYVSNVETYLIRDGIWSAFCANVASLPLDDASVIIRPGPIPLVTTIRNADGTVTTSYRARAGGSGPAVGLVPMANEVQACRGR